MPQHFSLQSLLLRSFFLLILTLFLTWENLPAAETQAEEVEFVCPDQVPAAPATARNATYKDVPYAAGEEARYELKYGRMKVLVGYGYLRVERPQNHEMTIAKKDDKPVKESRWHRVYSAEGTTGDWYRMVFRAHNTMRSISRPWDHGASRFYINQNEEKPFSRRNRREKWLDFDHVNCTVETREINHVRKRERVEDHVLEPGAMDALSAVYHLRSYDFKIGKTERLLVHTSEQNWWLEATPLKEEEVTVNAGTFKTFQLDIKSYLGQELQQRGDLKIWIASEHPNRPMVKVEGEVTFGRIALELDRFTPGS